MKDQPIDVDAKNGTGENDGSGVQGTFDKLKIDITQAKKKAEIKSNIVRYAMLSIGSILLYVIVWLFDTESWINIIGLVGLVMSVRYGFMALALLIRLWIWKK